MTDSVVDSLLGFFTDEGDWAYVMDYEGCGIVSVRITSTADDDLTLQRKRIVIKLRCCTVYRVTRMVGTPSGFWEVSHLDPTGYWLCEEPFHHTTPDLFKTFKDMLNRDDILRPLGGEDTLRLMCEADCFVYIGGVCRFRTPLHKIEVGHYHDRLDKTLRWSLVVKLKGEIGSLHISSCILDPGVLARTFEWATHYTLEF